MVNETPVSPKRKSSFRYTSIRKRLGFSIFLVVVIIVIIVLSQLFISLLIYDKEIEIITSKLQSNNEYSINYLQVSVDIILYNPGRLRGTTVWVEITNQPSGVSFSKTQYVQLDFRELKTLTFNFILDKLSALIDKAEKNLEPVEFYYKDSQEDVKIWGDPSYFNAILDTLKECIKVSQSLLSISLIAPTFFSLILLIFLYTI